VFSLLYHWVPIIKIKKRAVVVGAIWAAILWELAKEVFGYYLYHFATYGKVYGAYALIVVIAFWLYYSATVFVFGAVIAKLYHNRLVEPKA
jgi:membrane protein